jgi:DNA-binding beta-propeller fold protein YncE
VRPPRSKLITWNLVSGTPVASPSETTVGTGGTNNNAFDVAVTPDNVHIYVTTLVDGKLFVFDQSLAAVTSIITSGKPRYIAFDYPGETAVIPNENGWVDFIK